MAQMFRNCFQTGSYWPIVVGFSLLVILSATGIVVASPSWKTRIISSVTAASSKVAKAAYNPATAPENGSAEGDYIQGLARAVPGLVHR